MIKRVKRSQNRGDEGPDHPTARRLTQSEMVLIAFLHASNATMGKVPYEDLVLQAWKDFPDVFSLRNYPEHPDASDIHKKLYQSLKSEVLVVSLGNKVFRLSEKGLDQAIALEAAINGDVPIDDKSKGRLSRGEDSFIQHALRSRALTAWRAGDGEKLVDYDARMFFQFSTATSVDERQRRRDFALETIRKARKLGLQDGEDLENVAIHLAGTYQKLF